MDFDLSEDQLALRAGASDVLADLASPTAVRAHTTTGAPFDRVLWRAMVDQGWLGVELDEASGGLGLGWGLCNWFGWDNRQRRLSQANFPIQQDHRK